MSNLTIPEGYVSALSIKETQHAIKYIKDHFERQLAKQLNLTRVSAPLFVIPSSGLNDNLNGVERPVSFEIKDLGGETVEVVHSLAKWKRMALKEYGFVYGEGLYTDMKGILGVKGVFPGFIVFSVMILFPVVLEKNGKVLIHYGHISRKQRFLSQ